MKKYSLTLTVRTTDGGFLARSVDTIEDDNITSLLAQFVLVIARIVKVEEELKRIAAEKAMHGDDDDDIPF